MEYQTPAGIKYEVPETQNFFGELRDERPRLSPDLVASLVVRLESEIHLRESEIQTAYSRLKEMGELLEINQRRVEVLEISLDEERYNAIESIKKMNKDREA